jgi:hypothetical protein
VCLEAAKSKESALATRALGTEMQLIVLPDPQQKPFSATSFSRAAKADTTVEERRFSAA